MNTEAASEIRRPGRPQSYETAQRAALSRVWPEIRTLRGLHNKSHASKAFATLIEQPGARGRWQWILGADEQLIGKESVLVELGRLGHPEAIFAFADRICELAQQLNGRLTVKEAASKIRRIRMEHAGRRVARPSVYQLSQALLRTVDEYRATHPGMPLEDVLDALNTAYSDVQEIAEDARAAA